MFLRESKSTQRNTGLGVSASSAYSGSVGKSLLLPGFSFSHPGRGDGRGTKGQLSTVEGD